MNGLSSGGAGVLASPRGTNIVIKQKVKSAHDKKEESRKLAQNVNQLANILTKKSSLDYQCLTSRTVGNIGEETSPYRRGLISPVRDLKKVAQSTKTVAQPTIRRISFPDHRSLTEEDLEKLHLIKQKDDLILRLREENKAYQQIVNLLDEKKTLIIEGILKKGEDYMKRRPMLTRSLERDNMKEAIRLSSNERDPERTRVNISRNFESLKKIATSSNTCYTEMAQSSMSILREKASVRRKNTNQIYPRPKGKEESQSRSFCESGLSHIMVRLQRVLKRYQNEHGRLQRQRKEIKAMAEELKKGQ
eukprot:TRINITY_DN11044_c0_g1_i1.p1 TRINITY_DN11044_c0_g1~~TRINITY_DN11044_c0_g1_i1.p1  ORF type:complete len:305 (-),score=27.36 TRINITY_DN11044_c0_g1_i1:93-1007(-)